MKTFNNEKVILASDNNKIFLTNYRVHMQVKEWGFNYSIGIFLEDISSVEVKYKSNILLLLIGCLIFISSIIFGLTENESEVLSVGMLVGLISLFLWWLSRRHVICISPNGGAKMTFSIRGFDSDKIDDFILKLSQAKEERISLNKLN